MPRSRAREGSPFTIYGHAKVLAILKSNSLFNVLNEKLVGREPIEVEREVDVVVELQVVA